MYDGQLSLISNYINPIIGDLEVQSITPRVVDKYIQTLQKTPSAARKNRKTHAEYVTNSTIERIFKLLRCAFKQAVRWELIGKNPFDNAILPKTVYKKRDIWDADTIRKALDQCEDSKLYIAMNLSFACSLRMGEILGLSWKNVHIEDEDIAAMLNIGRTSAYNLVKEGHFKTVRIGNAIRISKKSFDEWLDSQSF